MGDFSGTLLWDTTTEEPLAELSGIDEPVFSPDGTLIATIRESGNVQLWGIP
jgi:WD40 repeat protein